MQKKKTKRTHSNQNKTAIKNSKYAIIGNNNNLIINADISGIEREMLETFRELNFQNKIDIMQMICNKAAEQKAKK